MVASCEDESTGCLRPAISWNEFANHGDGSDVGLLVSDRTFSQGALGRMKPPLLLLQRGGTQTCLPWSC